MDTDIVVSVCTITYNHGAFIEQTIKSVLAQKCTYKIEMIISDDCSKDNTREIISKYAAEYPNVIKPIFNEVNLGAKRNSVQSLNACKGKYVALLEGDDYWVDDSKIQKEVDLLEKQPDIIFCFTESYCVDANGRKISDNVPIPIKNEYTLSDVLHMNACYIPTATIVFKNTLPNPLPDFFKNAMSGDIAIQVMLLTQGNAICLHEQTAVYRKHEGGITNSAENKVNADLNLFKLFEDASIYYKHTHYYIFKKALSVMVKTMLIYGSRNLNGMIRQKYLYRFLKKYLHYQDGLNLKELSLYVYILYFRALFNKTKVING